MSSAEIAVQAFRRLENEDFRVLNVLEAAMAKHQYVPKELVARYVKFSAEETNFRLSRLHEMKLIRRMRGPYVGYALNYAGYDCLAMNALVKAEVLESFGKPLGVGKEADVYDALNPRGERIAVKFHRLGRISFRQTRRKREYATKIENAGWLVQSRLAAEKEFEALRLVFPIKVAVPKPIHQNRHVIAMGIIEGAELAEWREIPEPEKVLKKILLNIRKAYLKARIIHADLSEYNILLKPDMHILIIDWPQYVTVDHPNAKQLLIRDVKNVLNYFNKKHRLKAKLVCALKYVCGSQRLNVL